MKRHALWIALSIAGAMSARTRAAADDELPKLFELRDEKLELTDRALTLDPTGKRAALDVIIEPPIKPLARPATTPPTNATPARDLATVEARLARTWLGNEPLPADTFTVTLEHKGPWSLRVAFGVEAISRPGLYKLAVSLVDKVTAERLQSLTLSLDRPGAKLRAVPEAIAIDLVQHWPHEIATLEKSVSVELEEIGNKTQASVTTVDTGMARNDGRQIAAKMSLGTGTMRIEAGSAASLQVHLEGAFPPGKSTGEIEVRSEQTERLAIKYEVHTRLAGEIIAATLFVGWLAGLLVQVVLVRIAKRFDVVQQIAAIRAEAITLRQLFTGAAGARVNAVISACSVAEQKWRKIETARDEVRSQLDALKQELQGQLAAARTRVEAFAKAITPAWKLAAPVGEAMPPLREVLDKANSELAAGDPVRVGELIGQAFVTQVTELALRIEEWRARSIAISSKLETAPGLRPWPEPLRKPPKDAAARWRELLELVPTEPPRDPEELLVYLRAAHKVRVHVDATAISLAEGWRVIVEACAALTTDLDPDPLADLPGSLPELHDAETYLAALAFKAAVVIDELHTAVRKLVLHSHPKRKDLDTWLEDGKWTSAVAIARDVAKPSSTGAFLDSVDETAQPGFIPATAVIALDPTAAPLRRASPAVVAARARRFEFATLWATWLLSGLLLVVFYSVHFAAQQTATCLELLGVAGQAFSVDVGVAAIATAAKNLVK